MSQHVAASVSTPFLSCLRYADHALAVLFAVGYYYVKGRHEYDGPVHYVNWQAQRDVEMSQG